MDFWQVSIQILCLFKSICLSYMDLKTRFVEFIYIKEINHLFKYIHIYLSFITCFFSAPYLFSFLTCFFVLLLMSFDERKLVISMYVSLFHCFMFPFLFYVLCKKSLPTPTISRFLSLLNIVNPLSGFFNL